MVHGKNRIPYRIRPESDWPCRTEYDATISFGLLFEPEGSQYGKSRLQTRRGRQRYALRMQTVEPVFGQIKQGRGFRQFLLRGLEKVNGEWSLICTGHNLLKLFRFGVNLHRKARADGPAQRIRNFAEVVSTALFAKLSGGRPGQPAKSVVAIHWR